MKRMNLDPGVGQGSVQEKEQLIRDLMQDRDFAAVMKAAGVPQNEYTRHPYRLEMIRQNSIACRNCQGLSSCRQKQTGYREMPVYDGVLDSSLQPCRYLQDKQKKEAHLAGYLVNDLNPSMYQLSFAKIELNGEDPKYLSILGTVVESYKAGRGIFLYGPMGTGKTYLAACAANEYAGDRGRCAFVHVPSFSARIQAAYRNGEHHGEIEYLQYADFVVFDDIGAEDITSRYLNLLLTVLDRRMQENKMTWFTSNEDFRSLENHYSVTSSGEDKMMAKRILERIRVLSRPVYMDGKNRRSF